MPFKNLAARTLGYDREGKPVGIEGAYNSYLQGISGKRLFQKIAGNVEVPVNNENEVEPRDGSDIYTTIDINIQDVAQAALAQQLAIHNADHGCLALMEVATGEVRAIVNLTKVDSGFYAEKYNYVIGESTEPGSTFKLASLMAAMEDGYVNLEDKINTGNGTVKFFDRTMKDAHEGGYGTITLQQTFEKSSNVGVSKIIYKNYAKKPQQFVARLQKMGVGAPLKLEIPGEGWPRVKTPRDKDWYGTTLPWMSIGYETRLTPLQILNFYNAVANNGKMMKPMFVREIRKGGIIEKSFSPTVINPAICSQATIQKAKKMLEGVVQSGTATNLKNASYKIAGKTGTAQIANTKYGYKYKEKVSYQASFVGYFPAENPKYSCIVVVNAPSNKVYYGNLVAGPIFKEVADKVYANSLDIHKPLKPDTFYHYSRLPIVKGGNEEDIVKVVQQLGIKKVKNNSQAEWVNITTNEAEIVFVEKKVQKNTIPNVKGMGLKDAVYLLEKCGLTVKAMGRGTVKNQSIEPGTPIPKGGGRIFLELS